MDVKDDQGNLLRIGQVRKLTCYLLKCTEVVRIDSNRRDRIIIFICQESSLENRDFNSS